MLTITPLLDPERLFGRFDLLNRPSLIVAISGGSDSTALLLLLHDYLSRHGRGDTLRAVTVDHALRPESAGEARAVAALCATIGIHHRTMIWGEAKPASGIANAARAARYRLLLQAADEAGTEIILAGHTADDQAETIAMRAARGAGIGLAGMAPDTLLDGRRWLLRPLLEVSRASLRDDLRCRHTEWIDDPSNENPKSERVRVRNRLDQRQSAVLLDQAKDAAADRRSLAERSARLIAGTMTIEIECVRLSPALLLDADRAAGIHSVRLLLATLGEGSHLPDLGRATSLFDGLLQVGFSASLAGCVIAHRRAGITVRRERRRESAAEDRPLTTMFRDKALRPIIPGFDLPAYQALAILLAAPGLPASPLS